MKTVKNIDFYDLLWPLMAARPSLSGREPLVVGRDEHGSDQPGHQVDVGTCEHQGRLARATEQQPEPGF